MYKPLYTITNNLLSNIAEIEAAKQIINNAPLVPAWERRFREEARERTIHFSTKIEGNKLDYKEARKVIKGNHIKTFRRRDIQEIINYREVIEYISSLKNQKVTKKLLLEIHKKVMKNILPLSELGKFRTCEEALLDSDTYEVVFEPVEAEYIESEIEELLYWISKRSNNVHPVIRAGVLLCELVRVHPFTDGNGRTSRILATLCLYFDGYDIKRFFSLEEYYDQDLSMYYDALESIEDTGELTKWLEYFTHGLAVELKRIKSKILDISRDIKMRKDIGQVALNERQIKIINFIMENQKIRNQDWQELFPDVSDDTILRDMKDLIDKGVVKKQGRTKAARYILK